MKVTFESINKLTTFDEPTASSAKIKFDCVSKDIMTITASSFQLYVVYKKGPAFGSQNKLNVSFTGVILYGLNIKSIHVINQDISITWDFSNSSKPIYETIAISNNDRWMQYKLQTSSLKTVLKDFFVNSMD